MAPFSYTNNRPFFFHKPAFQCRFFLRLSLLPSWLYGGLFWTGFLSSPRVILHQQTNRAAEYDETKNTSLGQCVSHLQQRLHYTSHMWHFLFSLCWSFAFELSENGPPGQRLNNESILLGSLLVTYSTASYSAVKPLPWRVLGYSWVWLCLWWVRKSVSAVPGRLQCVLSRLYRLSTPLSLAVSPTLSRISSSVCL